METRRVRVEDGELVMFEIDNVYVSARKVASLIGSVAGVSSVQMEGSREFPDVRVRFRYRGREVLVEEPFGDSSVYWISASGEGERIDLSPIEYAFAKYRPHTVRRWCGDVLSLKLFKRRD